MSWGILLRWLLWSGYPSGLGLAMRVRENAPTANIRAYMREYRMDADVRIPAHPDVRIASGKVMPGHP